MKLGLYSALNFLNVVIMLSVASCTEQKQSDRKESRPNIVQDTAENSSINNNVQLEQPITDVASIQNAYANIVSKNKAGSLDSTSFKYSCHGEKEGSVSYFTEKGRLVMIVHRYNEYDHYSAEDRYYVKDSTLFFSFNKSVTWAFESGPEGATKDNIKERRVYLAGGEPIKCLEKNFVIRSQVKDNPRSEKVPSVEVDCPLSGTVMKPYQLLVKYRNNPSSGCLN
ncbi:MAG: hypothetical protein EOP48_09420 [Sphingobacteriales bacterium]|nr:MAG: hypothetical protein EOP48_09420 [Sphingobacteriales bacterium]